MPRDDLVVGLDIGTSKVAAVIGDISKESEIQIIGVGLTPSKGLRKGVVVNLEATMASIEKAIEDAEVMAGVEVGSVFAGVAGGHIRGINHHGVVIVSNRKNRSITEADVKRVVNQAKAIEMPIEREILEALPREFIVDDQTGIRDPVGMSGTRLEALIHIVTGAVTSIQNIVKAINNSGLTVEDIVLQPLASSESVLEQDEKDLGVILIDIGAGTSDIVIYVNGAVWHTGVIPIGGDQITSDIAIGLRTPLPSAEKIKKAFGCALTNYTNGSETVEVPGVGGRQSRNITKRMLAKIIEPRMSEILQLIHREIQTSGYSDMTPAGIVLTGGASMLDATPELAERVFGLPVRIGYPDKVTGLTEMVNDPLYATGVGLILHGARERRMGNGSRRIIKANHFNRILGRMKDWLSDYF
ncbi:cell division protein FtsA [Candidatus Poribacteria bacterium]|nr:cell division protein FtsA [Candidatus Poribacteria bacterium]